MNIMVFDVPAESGGALSVLNDFYSEVKQHPDKTVNWIFVLGKANLESQDNIHVIRFPWVKTSWWHRLYFDFVVSPRLVETYKANKVFSLQNTAIPLTDVDQIIYVHQALPFVQKRFSFWAHRRLWLYQNVIRWFIFNSIRRAKTVIVQADWLKEICANETGVSVDKFVVIPPRIEQEITSKFSPTREALSTFLYPASALTYKNHRVIVEATRHLVTEGFKGFRVIFTVTGKENAEMKELVVSATSEALPIEFVGPLPREKLFELYGRSVLLFPSYVETFGLPILEGRLHGTIVLASDCLFSREVLKDYENAYFFNPFSSTELAAYMKGLLTGEIKYKEVTSNRVGLDCARKEIVDVLIRC